MIKSFLAYVALAYLIASTVYMAVSWCCLDTPFKNSLTEEQKNIKQISAKKRKEVFCAGLFVAIVTLLVARPF